MPDPVIEDPVTPPAKEPENKVLEPAKVAERFVSKYGSAEAAIVQLANENYKHRDEKREIEKRLPPEGSVVLSADEAIVWQAYKSLGDPSEIKKLKTSNDELSTYRTTNERDKDLAKVAKTAGVEFEVLKAIASPSLAFETQQVKDAKTGQETPTVFVKDGDAEPVEFGKFAGTHWSAFLPALKPDVKPPAPKGTPRHNVDSPRTPEPSETRRRLPSLVR